MNGIYRRIRFNPSGFAFAFAADCGCEAGDCDVPSEDAVEDIVVDERFKEEAAAVAGRTSLATEPRSSP